MDEPNHRSEGQPEESFHRFPWPGLITPAIALLIGTLLTLWFYRAANKRQAIAVQNQDYDALLESYISNVQQIQSPPAASEVPTSSTPDSPLPSQPEALTETQRQLLATQTSQALGDLASDGDRKAELVRFLYDQGLINSPTSAVTPMPLEDAFWAGANLTNANFQDSAMDGIHLSGANLAGANLAGASLVRANLEDVSLTCSQRRCATLQGANLTGANLSGADLSASDGTNANFIYADFTNATLTDADLTGAQLAYVNFKGVEGLNTTGVEGSDWDLIAKIVNRAPGESLSLRGADLSNAYLAYLTAGELAGLDFQDADLTASNLTYSDLGRADFSNANLRHVSFKGATNLQPESIDERWYRVWALVNNQLTSKNDIKGADLSEANLINADLADFDLTGANLRGSNLTGANLAGANLTESNLIDAISTPQQLMEATICRTTLPSGEVSTRDCPG